MLTDTQRLQEAILKGKILGEKLNAYQEDVNELQALLDKLNYKEKPLDIDYSLANNNDTKFTQGTWIADIRGGCCAVYEESRKDDTNGMSFDDDRNIYYSSKDAHFNKYCWTMSEEAIANAHLISAAPEMYEMLDELYSSLCFNGGVLEIDDEDEKIKTLLAKARGDL